RQPQQIRDRHAERTRAYAGRVRALNAAAGLLARGRLVVGAIDRAKIGVAVADRALRGLSALDVAPGLFRVPSGSRLRIHDGGGWLSTASGTRQADPIFRTVPQSPPPPGGGWASPPIFLIPRPKGGKKNSLRPGGRAPTG